MSKEMLLIVGPCAAESWEQIDTTVREAKARGISHIRASLWKPRTRPGGFEGLGLVGLELLRMIADRGLIPATEVMRRGDAEAVVDEIAGRRGKEVLIWTGARTGVGQLIRDIAEVIRGETRARMMVKNPMEKDISHWLGMVEYAVAGCGNPKQVLVCHRGFSPGNEIFRNPPDMKAAVKVRKDLQKTFGVMMPLLVDPSHISGRASLVGRVVEEAIKEGADGFMIEVHPDPNRALTDNGQQLNWKQFDGLMMEPQSIRQNLATALAV